ncbi:MAG: hypothetical protein V7644_1986 [Actinomycetota bacterium]|jgi:hypothetical protein
MIAPRAHPSLAEQTLTMGKSSKATCSDCYFRRAGLCALPGETTCPTFRVARAAGGLAPPPQPQLVLRPLAAAHAAA